MDYPPLNQYCLLVGSFLLYFRMARGQDASMAENLKTKLDAIMSALVILSHRTAEIEGVMAGLHNDGAFVTAQPRDHQH